MQIQRSVYIVLGSACLALLAHAQATAPVIQPDSINLTGLTTPISVHFNDRVVNGSGFFYVQFAPDSQKDAEKQRWHTVQHIYVVTAKHVVQPTRLNKIKKLTYALRRGTPDHVEWQQMDLEQQELGKRLHLCAKESVDVAVIDVTDRLNNEIMDLLKKRSDVLLMNFAHAGEFPENSKIEVQPGDDVLVIGYPEGLYDAANKLPILKTGVLNTPIGLHFDGLDAFLIDFKYYEGSSGSLIIGKPTHFGINEGRLAVSENRQYVFLGIYEGEYYANSTRPQRADLGLGWYYYNIEDAIKNPPLIH